MKIRILHAERSKEANLDSYINELEKRIRPWARLEEQVISASARKKLEPKQRKTADTKRLLEALHPQEYCIVLSESGKLHDSKSFAEFLRQLTLHGHSRIAFLVGGAYGLDESLIKGAKSILSLSPMTYTSQLARVVLVEQLYRALSIIHGTPYHKD